MMKKILFPMIALLALAACSKVTPVNMPDGQQEVSFEVANYVPTKADVKYDVTNRFGTYSWYINDDGKTVTPWMINQTVGFAGGKWITIVNPFYWPKTGSADFISYSPFAGENGKAPAAPAANDATTAGQDVDAVVIPEPVITRVKDKDYTFEYPSYRVSADSPDLMYGDWANANANVDKVKETERDPGYKGVPTLFHHALAKISVDIRATFLDYEKTTWEVTLQKAEIQNVKNTGSLKLTMDASQKWVKPADGVWTIDDLGAADTFVLYALPEAAENPDGTAGPNADNPGQEETVPGMPLTTSYQNLLSERFVLPQFIDDQKTGVFLHLRFFIKTTQATGLVNTEIYDKTLPLSGLTKTPCTAWKMNQFFAYKIDIKPTAVVDPGIPDKPTDAELDFVPAVAGWEGIEAVSEIIL